MQLRRMRFCSHVPITNGLFFSFRYVLTRRLNSDPVESLFSSLRQFNGGNDRVDARAAVFTVEKILKVLFSKQNNAKCINSCKIFLGWNPAGCREFKRAYEF